ncbi:MAG: hypothetical protein JO265_16650 [Acidimicrobiia bacterium]|nr:hypothetical protein [Acidimicrobiia bacterium]
MRVPRVPPARVAIALAVALLAAGLAVVGVRAVGGGHRVAARAPASTSTLAPSSTVTSAAGSSTTSAPPGPPPTQPVPPALAAAFSQIQAEVSQIRGLPWLAPLDISVANDADFVRQLNFVNQRDLHPARMQGDGVTLQLLQLFPQNVDYVKSYMSLLSGAVLGFYDAKTKKLLVRDNGTTLTPEKRITVAHEMLHALTDQHFQFGPATYALDAADKEEQGTAYSGLLEGDAKLMEALFAGKYLSPSERQQAAAESNAAAGSVPQVPQYLLDSLYWPYTTGKDFVVSRYRTGGYAAVNAAYQRPPDSTLVVQQPQLYDAGTTWTPPALPDVAGATGCTPVRTNTLGTFTMTEMLEQHLDPTMSQAVADGWSGDSFATVRCGSARGFADRWTAPDTTAAGKLVSALSSWAGDWSGGHTAPAADGRFSGPTGAGRIVAAGTRIDLILADDAPTADKVNAALGD